MSVPLEPRPGENKALAAVLRSTAALPGFGNILQVGSGPFRLQFALP